MRYADLCSVTQPVVSVITPSLNHANEDNRDRKQEQYVDEA